MPELTIDEMIQQVPEGGHRVFEPVIADEGQEQYFRVWDSADHRPDRLEWHNKPQREDTPWSGTRTIAPVPVTRMPPPHVTFKGPSRDVVDFYGTGCPVNFISDALFRLIDGIDPNSLEHVEFAVQARDSVMHFHAVMPSRILEAVDPRRTRIVIHDEDYGGTWFRTVRFPDGIIFDNEALRGVASFTDIDAGGWHWSKELIELAKARGIRGLYAMSVAASPQRQIARL